MCTYLDQLVFLLLLEPLFLLLPALPPCLRCLRNLVDRAHRDRLPTTHSYIYVYICIYICIDWYEDRYVGIQVSQAVIY